MRTTLTIKDTLLRQAKAESLRRNLPLSEVVEEALRVILGTQVKGQPRKIRPLKTMRGDGLLPGVDLTSSVGLLETMEGR